YQGQEFQDHIKKVAVYLDGHQYHASEEHNVFERDINIRNAIVAQPEFTTWTLTWEDLNLFQKQLEGDKLASDKISLKYKADFLPHYSKLLQTIKNTEERINYALASNNVERILFALTHPTSIFSKS